MVISWPAFFLTVALISAVAVGITLILLPPPRPLPDSVPLPALPATAAATPVEGTPNAEPAAREGDTPAAVSNAARESKLSIWQWQLLVGALVAFAAVPGAAAISASTLYPAALMCSPAYLNGQLSGNLIATSGEWAYMVEYRRHNYSHDYFSVVPLSSVRLMAIGRYGDCATLARSPSPSPSAHPSATP